MTGNTKQNMMFSFQFLDAISEILTPILGWFMAGLELAKYLILLGTKLASNK